MSRRWYLVFGITAAVCIGVGVWWYDGGQHWLAYQTGTYCGSTGPRYCYWSGFGSVFPWVLLGAGGIIGVLWSHLRVINCHERGCPRIGLYQVAGGEFRYCGKHHPDWKGKHPSPEHIRERMHLYVGERPGPG